jgi:hypothetical protein
MLCVKGTGVEHVAAQVPVLIQLCRENAINASSIQNMREMEGK